MRYLMKQQQHQLMIIVFSWLTVLTLPIIHATDDDQKKLLADTGNNKDLASSHLKESNMLGPLSGTREADLSKRASFMASRGKKESDDTTNNQLASNLQISDNSNQFDAKRASSFLPMRGRKEYYPQWFIPSEDSYYDESKKRAAFIGMRGRKNSEPISNYFDQPYDDVYKSELDAMKRASFMAMRGRKSSGDYGANGFGQREYYVPTQQISNALSQIKIPNWMEGEPVISDSNSELMDKRARAFYGARGKRSVSDSGSADHHSEHVDINREQLHNNGHNENFFATRG